MSRLSTLAHPLALALLCLCLALGSSAATIAGAAHGHALPTALQSPEPTAPRGPLTQTAATREVSTAILIRWRGQPGVNRYRLQLARDGTFRDVVYDRPVEGRQHVVRGLPPGDYFWRVAPAAAEASAYTRPQRVVVSATAPPISDLSQILTHDESAGWRTAAGEVTRLVPARIRAGAVIDLVGVVREGHAFALDGLKGTLLWNVRYGPAGGPRPAPPQTFIPLISEFGAGRSGVIVAYDGGVRSLRGDTGQENWRAPLEGYAVGGALAKLDGDAVPEVVVVTADPHRLYVLSRATGAVKTQIGLKAAPVGAPCVFDAGGERAVAVALRNGELELRGADGRVFKQVRLEGELTTAPLLVARGQTTFIVAGTDRGLAALTVPDLKLLGRITITDGDAVRGILNAADVDGDGNSEIALVTGRGRVALVSAKDGNVSWHAEGATDASGAAFADLNCDNVLDLLVPGGTAFALGFSGLDGSLLMRVEEGDRRVAVGAGAAPRALVVAPTPAGQRLLIGSDPARVGLRAIGLPKGGCLSSAN